MGIDWEKKIIIQFERGNYFIREKLNESRLFFNRITDVMKWENWIGIATELSPVYSNICEDFQCVMKCVQER